MRPFKQVDVFTTTPYLGNPVAVVLDGDGLSTEEMQHAVMVSEQIDFLGGVPTIDVEKREISDDALAMLKQDLWGEDNAITRYKERIATAERLQEYGLRRVLEDILIQEEEHKRDLMTAIDS